MQLALAVENGKTCARCKQIKSRSEFGRAAHRKDGYRPYCRDCERANNRRYYQANKEAVLRRTKAWAQAHPEVGRETTRQWRERNRDKVRARKRADYEANKDEIQALLRDNAFRRKYGISLAERDAMAKAQDYRCAICGRPEGDDGKRLAVDHDHTTGRVRALLCQPCNQGLGHFQDDPQRLTAAADYVRMHAEQQVVAS